MTWWDHAACRGWDTKLFFPERPGLQHIPPRVAAVCRNCPVRQECGAHAVQNREYGIWGGHAFSQFAPAIERDAGQLAERRRLAGRARALFDEGYTRPQIASALGLQSARDVRALLRLVP